MYLNIDDFAETSAIRNNLESANEIKKLIDQLDEVIWRFPKPNIKIDDSSIRITNANRILQKVNNLEEILSELKEILKKQATEI